MQIWPLSLYVCTETEERHFYIKAQLGQLFVLRKFRGFYGGVAEESVVICDAASLGRRNPN
jgi:hypothetical protein